MFSTIEFIELSSSWELVFGIGENIWDVSMFCCPTIVLIILDFEEKVIFVIDEDDEACISVALSYQFRWVSVEKSQGQTSLCCSKIRSQSF